MTRKWLRRLGLAVALLMAVGAVVVWIAWAVGSRKLERARVEVERELGILDLAALMRPEVEEGANAATWLREGALMTSDWLPGEAAVVSRGGVASRDPDELYQPLESWGGVEPHFRRLAAANRNGLETMARSIGCSEWSWGVDYLEGPNAEIPPLTDLLRGARLLLMDAKLALIDADLERFERDVLVLDRLATSLADESTLITTLVAFGADRYLLEATWELARSELAEPAVLERVAALLDGRDPARRFRRGLRGEATMIRNGLTGLVAADGARAFDLFRQADDPLQFFVALPFDRLLTAETLAGYAEVSANLELPWPELRAKLAELGLDEESKGSLQVLVANLDFGLVRLKGYESSLELARRTLAYRLTGAIEPLPRDPFTGRTVEFEVLEDGSGRLRAVGAEELWLEGREAPDRNRMPRFAWEARVQPTPTG